MGWFFFFFLKELCDFPAASGSSSSPLNTFGSGIGWGGDVALLLVLDAFCVRIIFLTLRIKLEDKCLGILLSIFHGCGMVVSSAGNWCPGKFCFIFIIYRTGRWESTCFKYLLNAGRYAGCLAMLKFIESKLLNLQNHSLKQALGWIPLYRGGELGADRGSDLPEVTQLVRSGPWI